MFTFEGVAAIWLIGVIVSVVFAVPIVLILMWITAILSAGRKSKKNDEIKHTNWRL